MSGKKEVLDYYLQFPSETLAEMSFNLNISKGFISQTIANYFRDIHIFKELFFCFSLLRDSENGYLFDDIGERQVEISQKEIQNKELFTQYELDWMRINYNLK